MHRTCRLEGKVAVITGAASGIGEASARLFVEDGARVVVADIQDELGLQVVESIGTDKATYRHCDVTDEKQVEDTVAYAVEKYAFDEMMAINVRGSALAVKHAARVMVDKKIRGSIICNMSLEGIVAGAASLADIASKHAVVGIVKAAAPYGLDAAPMEAAINGNANLKGVTLSTMHVAQSALFLASDESAYTSGQNLAVDGGLSSILKLH
ncbi:hypothetical protein MTR67_013285 [Solanum verrucosum]|uniref:Short chain alcohol dehydrogenase n=1 Tax=Solanum verrucosum TaxID=315347 RepID=A0AAF0TNQ0_SOLVR|nr:hypothetical protein MTR67_013285 [Solanum verrucosum]